MENQVDSRRIAYYVFIFLLALLFALEWGPGSKGCTKAGPIVETESVATVNGKPIPLKDFAQQYAQQVDAMRRQGLPAEFAKQLGLDKQILDRLINDELLAQAAEAKGLAASDADLLEVLKKQPEFQKDGQFDFERYQQVVREYEGTTESAFEARLRRRLASQRMLQLIEAGVVVADDEVKARYQKEGNTAKATFVRFAATMYAEKVGTLKPAEVEAWAKTHEKEIEASYEQNRISYFVPEKVKARQILIRVDRDAPLEKKAEAKLKAENLRKEIVENKKPFAELAKQFSEDASSREKGGDLGLVDKMQLPGEFADKLFALQPGEVTMAVESPVGYLLGTVEEKKAPEQKPLDQVRSMIAGQLAVREKARDLAKADAEKALAELKKGKKLADQFPAAEAPAAEKFAPESKPQAKETGEFNSLAETVPQLGAAPEVAKAIFARTEAGTLETPVQVGDAYVVVVVDERKAPSDVDFAAKRAQLKTEAIKGKQFEVREAFLKSLSQGGNVVRNEKAIAKVMGEG